MRWSNRSDTCPWTPWPEFNLCNPHSRKKGKKENREGRELRQTDTHAHNSVFSLEAETAFLWQHEGQFSQATVGCSICTD